MCLYISFLPFHYQFPKSSRCLNTLTAALLEPRAFFVKWKTDATNRHSLNQCSTTRDIIAWMLMWKNDEVGILIQSTFQVLKDSTISTIKIYFNHSKLAVVFSSLSIQVQTVMWRNDKCPRTMKPTLAVPAVPL